MTGTGRPRGAHQTMKDKGKEFDPGVLPVWVREPLKVAEQVCGSAHGTPELKGDFLAAKLIVRLSRGWAKEIERRRKAMPSSTRSAYTAGLVRTIGKLRKQIATLEARAA